MKINLKKINQLNEEISKKYQIPINFIIMNRSDHYPAAYFRSSLFILALTYLIFYFIPFDIQDPIWLIGLSIPAVILGQFFAIFDRYKKIFISKAEMKEESYQQALEQSYQLGVLNEPTSIFFYFSLFERRVELFIPDSLKEQYKIQEVKAPFKKLIKGLRKQSFESSLKDFYHSVLICPTSHEQKNEREEVVTEKIVQDKQESLDDSINLVEVARREINSQQPKSISNPYNVENIFNEGDD